MNTFSNKRSGIVKEEGELTDDEDDIGRQKSFLITNGALSNKVASPRHFSSELYKNIEAKNKSASKRKDHRRRFDPDNRRSSRAAADTGVKKYYRDHQDFRLTSVSENYTPSKFWANRRFRASSVRPLSPKHAKPSSLRRTDSPQKYRGGSDIVTDDQDELERLEREQKRIREQLKSLEEEEKNDENSESNCVLDARAEIEELAVPFTEASSNADFNDDILQNERSDDEDMDIQELRRLALATSERHIRLMAIEPPPSQPGIPSGDVVVIPDVEPDLPEPEVVTVEEEEDDVIKNISPNLPARAVIDDLSVTKISSAKKKSKKSSKLKKKGHSATNSSSVDEKGPAVLKYKLAHSGSKKSKTKHHKKGETRRAIKADEWIRQGEELRILVMDDPEKALEKLLKFATEYEGTKKPIATGTIKDIKRQKQIPVLSDKRAVQNFAQQSVDKKKFLLEKAKAGKDQAKKSFQLQDNYEEVEMDIDSNAENEDESTNFVVAGDLTTLPVSFPPVSYQQILQPVLATTLIPSPQFISLATLPFDIALPPPLPPPIPTVPPPPIPPIPPPPIPSLPPPPLPLQPPTNEHGEDDKWTNQHAELEERIAEFMKMKLKVNNSRGPQDQIYEDRLSLIQNQDEESNKLHSSFLPQNLSFEESQEYKTFNDSDWSFPNLGNSLDDDITRRLRRIRQNQELSLESQSVNSDRINSVLLSRSPTNEPSKSIFKHLIKITGELQHLEEKKTTNFDIDNQPISMRKSNKIIPSDSSDLYNFFEERFCRSPDEKNRSDFVSAVDSPKDKEKYRDLIEVSRNSPVVKTVSERFRQNMSRRNFSVRSPSPARMTPRRHLRNSSNDGSGSPHSSAHLRRPLLDSASKHKDNYNCPPKKSTSRDSFRDMYNERISVNIQQRHRKTHYNEDHQRKPFTSYSQNCVHSQRRDSEEEDGYLPEMPPTKKLRPLSPPPYVPTSISTIIASHTPPEILHQSSDSEEEDPAALRNKLLADVFEKRKTTIEVTSNDTTPSAVSPKQDSLYSESSEAFFLPEEDHVPKESQDTRFNSNQISKLSKDDEDDDEDVLPPPVISRVSRCLSKSPLLKEFSERTVNSAGDECEKEGQLSSQVEQQSCHHTAIKDKGSNLYVVLEDDNDDLSGSDLESLRAYVIRATTHSSGQTQQLTHNSGQDQDYEHSDVAAAEVYLDKQIQGKQDEVKDLEHVYDEDLKNDFDEKVSSTGKPEEMQLSEKMQDNLEIQQSGFIGEQERVQHLVPVGDASMKLNVDEHNSDSVYYTSSPKPFLYLNQSDSRATSSSPLANVEQHTENQLVPPENQYMLESPTAGIARTFDHNKPCSQIVQEPITSSPVTSTSTTSSYPCLSTVQEHGMKNRQPLSSNLGFTHSNSPSTLTLSGETSHLKQGSMKLIKNSALNVLHESADSTSTCNNECQASTIHSHASMLHLKTDPTSEVPMQTLISSTKRHGATVEVKQNNLRHADKNKTHIKSVVKKPQDIRKESSSVSSVKNTFKPIPAIDQSTILKSTAVTHHHHHHVADSSDLPSSFMSYSERQSLSAYSSQPYGSGAGSSSGARKYANMHMLPVHPQVLVPVNSSSDSENEGDDGDVQLIETTASINTSADAVDMIFNNQELLAEVQSNEKRALQLLSAQEKLLTNQQLSIQKEQRSVKLLVKRAVKFLETQQKEQEKQKALNAQLLALSHKLKTSERFVMLLKAEKEQTEKQVQHVTEKLLQKKTLYERKFKAVTSLGTKLLGPGYAPKIHQPSVASTSQEKQSLNRAQEKQKLMEKEQQIAEKLRRLKQAQAEKGAGRPKPAQNMPNSVKNPPSKWKSQDVIHIDDDVKLDVLVTPRRRSLLEVLGPSTTPNIPVTARKSSSGSNLEKENIASEADSVKAADKDTITGFKMPGGTLLAHFCKLQREKALKCLKHPNPTSSSSFSYSSLSGLRPSSSMPKLRLHGTEKHQKHSNAANKSYHSTSHSYSSPLLMFKSYRFNSYFRTKENMSLQSSTFSNKINPNSVLCPYDLQGTCSDDSCQQQHPREYKYTDHELLEDIISYCPMLAGAKESNSLEEVGKSIVTFVDNLLSKHKGKMSIDDLCLWLLSQVNEASGKRHPHTVSFEPRRWKPQPKDETGLGLDLSQQLNTNKFETINMDRNITDKDTVINDEDTRYFAADVTELLLLETSIMENQTNIKLWQKLASKKLYDPNKSPTECLEEALSVLSRGLEVNKNDPDLWHMYLSLYKRHSEVKEFPEFCQMALEYAPSYALWFLYLDYIKTVSEKEKVSTQTLQFLCNAARDKRKSSSLDGAKFKKDCKMNTINGKFENSVDLDGFEIKTISDSVTGCEVILISDCVEELEANTVKDMTEKGKVTIEPKIICDGNELDDTKSGSEMIVDKESVDGQLDKEDGVMKDGVKDAEGKEKEKTEKSDSFDWAQLSHQILEMVLYKTSLYLINGRITTAAYFLQATLHQKRSSSSSHQNIAKFLTTADHLVLWLVYIHVLEWRQLPQDIFSLANQNPGRLMAKENIFLPWSTKTSLHNEVNFLVKLHEKAAKVWECSRKDEQADVIFVKLVQSLVSLLISQNRQPEAIAKCRSALTHKHLVDIWLTLADLHASCQDKEAAKNVFNEALSVENNSKLKFYQSVFLYQQEDTESALANLEQFAASHFNVVSRNPHHCDHGNLYGQLLKQQESFSLHAAQIKENVPDNVHKDIFIWLCYSLWLEMKGRVSDTVEIFERSLTHACNPDDLILVWQNYISYLMRSKTSVKEVRDIIFRSIVSIPTKFPVPFSSSMWVNYYYINELVEAWLAVLSPEDILDFMEMCLSLMPSNIRLLLRAIDICLEVKETRRAYSWCKFAAVQTDRPANFAFWKMTSALAQVEGTPKEVERMMIACVETMPLAVSGWKDFLLFEVTRENLVAVQKLLKFCQQLELNIDSFATTLSAS